MLAQLTSLKMSSPSLTSWRLSIAATRTTQWSWPPADLEPAVQEVAQPWEPRFVPQETVLETVRCLSSRKPMRLNHDVGQRRHGPRVLSHGAQPDAMSGGIKAAATTQPADAEGQEHVDG